ncbi:type II toxin-antitoxin system HipA family toxin [Nocardiopsis sp. LOL_012]|uniref:type II toxin-antitoxin system HipA family toxin n=1 Tax=Nocardiopsis sp. LOL_012 TaxID=3345409 RepID=UPI003A886D66
MYQTDTTAQVYLGSRRVGTLGYRLGNTWFDYEDLDPDHPVLGQGFERDPRKQRTASGSVPEWFAGLLPETGSGLRQLVAASLGKKKIHDFVLLCHAGEDLPGAVRVVPDSVLDDLPEHDGTREHRNEGDLRFSFAGVQPKFSMRFEGKALVLPATGKGGDWMVKLADQRFPEVPENEYSMLRWAARSGIDVPEICLEEGGVLRNLPRGVVTATGSVLAVRRFDRTSGGPVHQEDFAQIREVSTDAKYDRASYEGIGRAIGVLCPEEDVLEYVRRLVAMVLMGNADAHLKNWTLRYPDGHHARLSPAYDLVCVAAYPELDANLAFPLGGTRRSEAMTVDSFRPLARSLDAHEQEILAVVSETVQAMLSSWPGIKQEFPVPGFVSRIVDKRLEALPLISSQG